MGKYKLIKEDTMKNLIEFLDEVQFDAATDGSTEDMHKVNFCNWAINELLNSPEARIKDITDSKPKKDKLYNITKSNGSVIQRTGKGDYFKKLYESKGWKVEEV